MVRPSLAKFPGFFFSRSSKNSWVAPWALGSECKACRRLSRSCRFSLPGGGGASVSSISDVSRSFSGWGRRVAVQISFCQSGMSVGRCRGEGGGVEEGEVGMPCQVSAGVPCFAPVARGLGGVEFHFLVRILLRTAREESSPLAAIFSRYRVSFVLSFRDQCWRFLLYSPIGISCRQCPFVVRLVVTLVTVHVVSPNSLRMGHHLNPHPSWPLGMSFPMCIARRRPTRRSCSSGIFGLYSMVIIPSNLLCLEVLLA